MYLLADHRENNGAIPFLESMVEADNRKKKEKPFKSGGGELQYSVINNAIIGDYSIMLKSRYSDKQILAAIFERKTWKDLAASLKDTRFITQREEKGCMIYYIIEGGISYKDDYSIGRVPFKSLHAKVRCMSLRGVHFFQTKDAQDTTRLLINLTRDLCRLYRSEQISFPKQDISVKEHDILEMIAKYPELADALTPHLAVIGGHETEGVIGGHETEEIQIPQETEEVQIPEILTTRKKPQTSDIKIKMWAQFPKVSPTSAFLLNEKFEISDLFTKDIRDEIAAVKYDSGTRFGYVRADKICSITYNGEAALKLLEQQTQSVKILSQIPGITPSTAKIIIENHSLLDLCTGKITKDQLANIKKDGDRRVGPKAAQNILEILTS